ncbi:MAG: DNA-directed DNA polymerase II small subunit [Candidatus Jordarchaeum sp.]|uniref:DNA-directed DNA polymerase II small subunit n=1 Tax=Candidatus Jordarchaeum sp. TaxID=2823881 RepID=UPI0040490D98
MQAKDRIKRALKIILDAGYQITPETLKTLSLYEDPEEIAKELISKIEETSEEIITIDSKYIKLLEKKVETINEIGERESPQIKNQISEVIKTEKVTSTPEYVINKTVFPELSISDQAVLTQESVKTFLAKDVDARFEVICDPTERMKGKGTLENFIEYFRDRYKRIYNIFLKRGDIENITKISEIPKSKDKRTKIIGIVTSIQQTKPGHMIIELEDLEDIIKAIIFEKNSEVIKKAELLMLDQVICLDGYLSKDIFIVNDLLWPDIPLKHTQNKANEPVCAAFISDIHFGSKKFLADSFKQFTQWLKGQIGDERSRELARRVKYLIIAGDLVDGIGIYPTQEEDLIVTDIYEQYQIAARYLEEIPEHIKIVAIPGGHDATRIALPQPAVPKEYAEPLYDIGVEMLGGPAQIRIHNVEVLIYHGESLNDVMAAIPIDQTKPHKAMIELIRGRHLCPIFGNTPIAPEPQDWLVIERVPDILHCGHMHINDTAGYRGVILINSGTFESQTSYQKSMGLEPTPAKPIILDLQSYKITQLDFF